MTKKRLQKKVRQDNTKFGIFEVNIFGILYIYIYHLPNLFIYFLHYVI